MSQRRTRHFRARSAQRHLRQDVLEFVITYGDEVAARNAVHVTVRDRALPPDVRGTALARLARGWIVIKGEGGALITCYRRRDAVRVVRRYSGRNQRRRVGGRDARE